ncbi:hypothetical protein D3C80_1792640 [compost metagenome]
MIVEAGNEFVSTPQQCEWPLQCHIHAALGLLRLGVVTQHPRLAGRLVEPCTPCRGLVGAVVVVTVGLHVVCGKLQLPVVGEAVLGGHEIVGGFQLIVHPPGTGAGGAGKVGLLAVGKHQRHTR